MRHMSGLPMGMLLRLWPLALDLNRLFSASSFRSAADWSDLLAGLLLLAPAAGCDSAAGRTDFLPGILLLLPPVTADFESTASVANLMPVLVLPGSAEADSLAALLLLQRGAACEPAGGPTGLLLMVLLLSSAEEAGPPKVPLLLELAPQPASQPVRTSLSDFFQKEPWTATDPNLTPLSTNQGLQDLSIAVMSHRQAAVMAAVLPIGKTQ